MSKSNIIRREIEFNQFTVENTEIRKKTIPYKKLVVPIRMRSVYWKYFGFPASEDDTILTKDKIVCILCKNQMIYNRNTSNLRMHLNSRHKNMLHKIDPNAANEIAKQKKKKPKTPGPRNVDGNIDYCDMGIMNISHRKGEMKDEVIVHEETSENDISNIAIIFPNNEDLIEYNQSKEIEDTSGSSEINEALLNFIINDLISPEIVDGKEFHSFLSNLSNKEVVIPNEKKLTYTIIPNLFNTCKEQLYNSIITTSITNISLSIEEWFTIDGVKCLSIYMHYLQKGIPSLFTRLLTTVCCTGSESVIYWTSILDHLFEEWSINSNAVTAVLISFSNDQLKEALIGKNFIMLPCFLFMIQELCSKHCFKHPDVSIILEKCRRLVKYIRDNKIELPEEYNVTSHEDDDDDEDDYTLAVDRPELWLTTYFMLKTLLRKKNAINDEVMNREYQPIDTVLDSVEWKIVADLVTLLEPLRTIVITLFEEKSSLISLLKPLIWKVNNSQFDVTGDESPLMYILKNNIKDVLSKAYTDENAENITQIATILDPRFKTFIQQGEIYSSESNLDELLTQFVQSEGASSPNDTLGEEKLTLGKKYGRTSGINVLFGNFCMNKPRLSQEDKLKMEVSHYNSETTALLEECPLEWWQHMKNRCPNLMRLAHKYLCVPAIVTHTGSHSLQDYYKFYNKRSMLSVNVADQLLFLHFNKNVA